mmetsp:Transcript_36797/g.87205  ORF Transcript_36797/g.87205 Transcript_36797/m.87205 type:complete len:218 (+) Transcript_36797:1280-1933(+)
MHVCQHVCIHPRSRPPLHLGVSNHLRGEYVPDHVRHRVLPGSIYPPPGVVPPLLPMRGRCRGILPHPSCARALRRAALRAPRARRDRVGGRGRRGRAPGWGGAAAVPHLGTPGRAPRRFPRKPSVRVPGALRRGKTAGGCRRSAGRCRQPDHTARGVGAGRSRVAHSGYGHVAGQRVLCAAVPLLVLLHPLRLPQVPRRAPDHLSDSLLSRCRPPSR